MGRSPPSFTIEVGNGAMWKVTLTQLDVTLGAFCPALTLLQDPLVVTLGRRVIAIAPSTLTTKPFAFAVSSYQHFSLKIVHKADILLNNYPDISFRCVHLGGHTSRELVGGALLMRHPLLLPRLCTRSTRNADTAPPPINPGSCLWL